MTTPTVQPKQSILFVDSGLADYQTLVDGVKAGTTVVLINADQDGVQQIADVLSQLSNVDSVHILSHGSPAEVYLGNATLSQNTLSTYQSAVQSWGRALSKTADILIYGCHVAKGALGQKFVQQLSNITQANIAASVDLTGAEALGGNWQLAFHCGQVQGYQLFEQHALDRYMGTLATETIAFVEDELAGEPLTSYTKNTTSYGNLTIKGTDTGLGTAFGSLTNLTGPAGLYDSLSQFGSGTSVGIGLNDGSNGATVGTWFTFATADGGEFDLVSLKMTEGFAVFTSMEAVGFRDGTQIGTQTFTLTTGTINQTISMTSTFDNVDEVRIRQTTPTYFDSGTPGQDGVLFENFIFQPIPAPTITSATYDASTNTFVVTGTNLVATTGATNDIDVTKLTLTGQGGATYTLTSSSVEIDSATQFTVALNATDQINVEGLLNKNGTAAVDATTFNIAAAANWNPAQTGNADLTGNGITVSNVQTPTITSATYDASTGVLVVTGTNLVKANGATNDITANKFTFTGEGGATYVLTNTSNVEITSATAFTITLSATDKAAINQIVNKNGTTSTSATTYNLAAADDWNTVIGNADISDTTGNGITVSNVAAPEITSATYDYSTNVLTVTGAGFLSKSGATNDIDLTKLTIAGEGGATYTLTNATGVEITSGTSFATTLAGADIVNVEALLSQNGTTAVSSATYNLAGAEDWAAGADATVNVADLTSNGITVSNYAAPAVTSATFDASTNVLTVTGTNLVVKSGATNDVSISKLTLTGEGGSYVLTSSDVELTDATTFAVTLNAADQLVVRGLLNKNGTASAGATTYNVAAAEDWMAGTAAATNVADLTGNGITVSNVQTPTITSATYDSASGVLVVTGTNFFNKVDATNDIVANKFTLTGEGATYTLTDTANVEITSGTAFTLTLSATDKAALNQIINKNGTSSTSATTYNLAAAEDWAAGADAAVVVADLAGNAVTASNVAVPTITSATYDYSTNVLTVTGTGFLSKSGATNDIDLSKLTITGEGGATYTLTTATDVEITSGTSFTTTLSGADLTNIEALLNKDGTTAASGATYNLAGAEDWAAGADASVNVADLTSNAITVSSYAAPTVTSATFDASTNVLTVTGTNLVAKSGVTNDVSVAKLTLTGEDGSYALTSSDVELTDATTFAVTLNAADQLVVRGLLNKNGTASAGATTYNVAAAEDWMAGTAAATNVADLTGNGITVSNVQTPTITSATYDSDTGVLVVTGTNFFNKVGATNDIVLNKLSFVGQGGGGEAYTLTNASNVEITSATSFSVTLAGADKTKVDALLNTIGTSAADATTYNLAAAEDWMAGADAAAVIADATNAVTVSINPKITSATYNAATGSLVVTGTNMQALAGVTNDITANKLTFTGEGGATYTLTDSANVELTSATAFTVALSATDKAAINLIVNKNGTATTSATTYNLAVADDWNAQVTAGDTSDTTGNGITVSNVAVPAITSSTYNASTGALVVTGTDFLKKSGATNDIVANKFTFTGEGGVTYTLTDSSNIEITSGTAFTVTLSATDKAALNQIINKNGTSSTGATTYNLAAAEDWAAGADAAVVVADLAGNGITASNVAVPVITSSTYDASTGALVVTGTGFLNLSGATNDIVANKFTFTGAGTTYTLTDTANVEITSGTAFTVTLSATDKAALNKIINKNGLSSTDTIAYNLAAAEDWAAGADVAVVVADLAGNAITASNVAAPVITSSTYDASAGALVVTGTGFLNKSGATNDIVTNKFTFTGAGTTYTLTDTANVEITSGTAFTVTLSATDKAALNKIINKNGTSSTDTIAYNLAAAEDWAAGADAAVVVADLVGNGITASNVAAPVITSSTYDASTGALVVTGTGFLNLSGATNDIVANKFTFTGAGTTYTLTDTANVEISSGTAFTVTLSATDKAALNKIINKNGTSSTDTIAYNLAAAEDWAAGADAAVVVADLVGNGITASNVAVPTITSATYNSGTGALVVTGTDLLSKSGATNDINANKFTFTGDAGGGGPYPLTDTANVEITSGTEFTLTLSATDKAAVNLLLNKNGTAATDTTTYNLAAAEDWAAGADAAVNVVDAAGNGITVTIPAPPSGGGGSSTPTPTPTTTTTDGVTTSATTQSDGTVITTIPIVEDTRQDDPTSLFTDHADIPVVTNAQGGAILTVSVPVGVGLSVDGQPKVLSKQAAVSELIRRIENKTVVGSAERVEMIGSGQTFLDSLASDESISVQTIVPTVSGNKKPNAPIIITGSTQTGDGMQALVIDVTNLPPGTILQLDNIAFVAIIGAVHAIGGAGQNIAIGDNASQFIVLGADDDILFGGGGDDTVGSLGGDDQANGDAGDDIVYGGTANDTISGGAGDDHLNGGLGFDTAIQPGQQSDYQITVNGNDVVLTHSNGEIDTLTDVELIQFTSGSSSLAIAYSDIEAAAHHLAKTWLGRDLTAAEGSAVQNWQGAEVSDIILAFRELPEAAGRSEKTTDELLAGLDDNPNIIRFNVDREFVGVADDDQGFLPLGLALNADGGTGHDVLKMLGGRSDVHLETVNGRLELTRLEDGAMLSLINAEAIAFDSGETVFIAHNTAEGILGRLFQSFFDRDATAAEWKAKSADLVAGVDHNLILDGFQREANLADLSNTEYVQAIYSQTLGRQATTTELDNHLTQINDGQISREWFAVEIASSDEAIAVIGNVILEDGWV